jgi:hypothetical protein
VLGRRGSPVHCIFQCCRLFSPARAVNCCRCCRRRLARMCLATPACSDRRRPLLSSAAFYCVLESKWPPAPLSPSPSLPFPVGSSPELAVSQVQFCLHAFSVDMTTCAYTSQNNHYYNVGNNNNNNNDYVANDIIIPVYLKSSDNPLV